MTAPDEAVRTPCADGERPSLVLVCASVDARVIRQVESGLRERGYEVQCVVGAERDEHHLLEVLRRAHADGLYVVARSTGLEACAVARIRQILRGEKIPFGRVLEATLEPGSGLAFENRIDSVARRMLAGRDTLIRERGRAIPGERPSSAEVAKPQVSPYEVDAWADSIVSKATSDLDDEDDERQTTSVDNLPLYHRELDTAHAETSHADMTRGDVTLPGTGVVEVTQSLHGGGGAPVYTPRDHTELVPIHTSPQAVPQASVRPDPAPVSMPKLSSEPRRQVRERQRPIWLGVAAIVAVVGVGGLGMSFTKDAPATDVADASGGAVADAPSVERQHRPSMPMQAIAQPKSSEVHEQRAKPTAPAKSARPDAASDGGAAHVADDARLVAKALRGRRIRAWNRLLVAHPSPKSMAFEQAAMYCARLREAKIGGWRLPTAGELNSIVGAKMAKRGVFWSETEGDAMGKTRLVVNAERTRIAAAERRWSGGLALCVRERS